MKLWDFIDGRLKDMGRNESWLVDQGIAQKTVDRIRHGGVIKDATKQKLALALGCTAGDINRALSKLDVPEPKAHEMDLLAEEIAPEAKDAIDSFMESGSEPEEPVRVKKIKWYPDQEAIAMPIRGPVTRITEPEVTALAVGAYRDKLLGICLQQLAEAAEANVEDATVIYTSIGRALLRELMS